MAGRLSGKRAVVTGAAGGIGSAGARAFATEGAMVGVLDRPGAPTDDLARELGRGAMALSADLGDAASVAAAFATWNDRHGGLDVLYACAGVQLLEDDGRITEVDLATWQRTHLVNAQGVFLTIKYAIPLMIASGGGSIIVCGSPTGLTMSGAGSTAYGPSKAAAMALARIVAADYAGDGIRSNVIVPGATETPLIATLLNDPDRRAELEASVPLHRIGTPQDLVGIAIFLASDESSYATGGTFAVDGGMINR